MRQLLLRPSLAVLAFLYATTGQAHEASFHCEAVTASVADAGFDDVVTVT